MIRVGANDEDLEMNAAPVKYADRASFRPTKLLGSVFSALELSIIVRTGAVNGGSQSEEAAVGHHADVPDRLAAPVRIHQTPEDATNESARSHRSRPTVNPMIC